MKLTFYKYHLPFSTPFVTSKRSYPHRKGFILHYSDDDFNCYGEASPLPGFSVESTDAVEKQLLKIRDRLTALFSSPGPADALYDLYENLKIHPSLQFGLDSLAYQIEAFKEGTSLQNYLFEEASMKMAVNAVISLDDNILTKASRCRAEGFQTVKIKVGADFDTELGKIKTLRENFPGLVIRIDANQAWSLDEALGYLEELGDLNIEYCEEPLKIPRPADYSLLRKKTSIPLALDESLNTYTNWHSLLPFTSVLILKPMIRGSFLKNFVTKRLADAHDNKTVVTSTFESGIGRMIISILASGLGHRNTAQGLGTGRFLAKDVLSDTDILIGGIYHLNEYQKWINIEPEKLKEISTHIF